MEMLGILLAFPATLIASVTYTFVAKYLLERFSSIRLKVIVASWFFLSLLVAEICLVGSFGVLHAREVIGRSFEFLHFACFWFGPPGLVNILLARRKANFWSRWYVVSVCCFFLAISIVFFNLEVTDMLYGPDGVGGPYSQR